MAKFMLLEIDNSKESAIKTGKWNAPGASFYDQLLNAAWYVGGVPDDAEGLNKMIKEGKYKHWVDFIEEAYLVAPVKKISNSPHGVTPFSRSGCKYPHHVIRNGKLVVSVPGIKAAYARALQMGVLKGEVKKHLERHIKELEMEVSFKNGSLSWNESYERRIDENFGSIESFITEKTGVNLSSPDPFKVSSSEGSKFPEVDAKTKKTTNPNDPESTKAVDITFYDSSSGDKVGEASVSSIDTDNAFLYNVEVFPEFRRKGYGNSIMAYCIENYKVAELTVEPSNKAAISLYKKFGFKKTRDWEENGKKLIVMRRDIVKDINEALDWIERFANDEEFRESVDINSLPDLTNKIRSPRELLEWMDCIQYGWIDRDGNIQGTGDEDDEEDFFHQYKLQMPYELIKSKVGVCWDQAELERHWFNDSRYQNCFAFLYLEIQDGEACPTHTCIIYKEPGDSKEVYWFEHSWGEYRGIHKYDDLESCITDIVQKHQKSHGDTTHDVLVTNVGYPDKWNDTRTCFEYMDHCRRSEKIDLNDIRYGTIFKRENQRGWYNPDPPAGRAATIVCYVDPDTHLRHLLPKGYSRPLVYDKLPDHLKNDAVHAWRARYGIELIHQEPSLEELQRIWRNWSMMSSSMKRISDDKSMELFGMNNEDHYNKLLPIWDRDTSNHPLVMRAGVKPVGESVDGLLGTDKVWLEKYLAEEGETIQEAPPTLEDDLDKPEDQEEKKPEDKPAEEDEAPPEMNEPEESEPPAEEEKPVEEEPAQDGDDGLNEPAEEEAPEAVKDPTPPPPKKDSMPKKTDRAETDRNGVRRKKLYIAFIEWCKEYNSKNTFGSIFDKDIFHNTYPFVPEDMRYFYRLANPILCVLSGDLTFFQVSELRKLNAKNQKLNEMMIFAATPNDLRVFNNADRKVYRGTEENGEVKLNEVLGDTFDTYLQYMVNKGDILNGPIDDDE